MTYKRNVFSIVTILFWFSLYAYMPQMTNYAKEMGASYKLIGLIGGAYGFTQTILRIPIGILSDRLMKRKVFIIGGITCAALSASSVYFFPSPYTLLIARLIAGISSATWVNFTILFLSYYDASESAKSIGIVTANSKIGQLFAMFIGGFIALKYSVREIFLMSIIFAIISLIFGFFIYEDKEKIQIENKAKKGTVLFDLLRNKRIIQISILGSIIQLTAYATNFGFTPIIAAKLGADNLQLSFLAVLFTLPQILFSILSGTYFARKFGEKKTLISGFLIVSIVCILTPFTTKLYQLYVMQLFSGIGNAVAFALLMSMVIKDVEKNMMTTTMGFYQAAYGVGMIIGPIVLGGIGDIFGLATGFIIIGLLGLASIWSIKRLNV